jgi:predicted amidophosphoribosyltransferase
MNSNYPDDFGHHVDDRLLGAGHSCPACGDPLEMHVCEECGEPGLECEEELCEACSIARTESEEEDDE